MKILFSIIINALILYIITFLLSWDESRNIGNWVILWCGECSYNSLDAWKTYIIWWIIIWTINYTIKPVLKILTLPLFFVFLWLVSFIVNAIILKLFDYIVNNVLAIEWISYSIPSITNFIIAVAIFTILNMFYTLLFSKK